MKSLIIFITFLSLSLSKLLKTPITNAILYLTADQRIIDVSINNNVISLSKIHDMTNPSIVKKLPINLFPGDIIKITAKKVIEKSIIDSTNTSGGIIASIQMLNEHNDTYHTNINEWKCNGESPIEVKSNFTIEHQNILNESIWIWNQRNTSEANCALTIPCEKKVGFFKKVGTKAKEIVKSGISKVANSKIVKGTSNIIKKGINFIKGKKEENVDINSHANTEWSHDVITGFDVRYRNNVIECLSADKKTCFKYRNLFKRNDYRNKYKDTIQCTGEKLNENWCINAKKLLK